MGQNIKLLATCVRVCARVLGVEYFENASLGVNGQPIANGLWGVEWSRD